MEFWLFDLPIGGDAIKVKSLGNIVEPHPPENEGSGDRDGWRKFGWKFAGDNGGLPYPPLPGLPLLSPGIEGTAPKLELSNKRESSIDSPRFDWPIAFKLPELPERLKLG